MLLTKRTFSKLLALLLLFALLCTLFPAQTAYAAGNVTVYGGGGGGGGGGGAGVNAWHIAKTVFGGAGGAGGDGNNNGGSGGNGGTHHENFSPGSGGSGGGGGGAGGGYGGAPGDDGKDGETFEEGVSYLADGGAGGSNGLPGGGGNGGSNNYTDYNDKIWYNGGDGGDGGVGNSNSFPAGDTIYDSITVTAGSGGDGGNSATALPHNPSIELDDGGNGGNGGDGGDASLILTDPTVAVSGPIIVTSGQQGQDGVLEPYDYSYGWQDSYGTPGIGGAGGAASLQATGTLTAPSITITKPSGGGAVDVDIGRLVIASDATLTVTGTGSADVVIGTVDVAAGATLHIHNAGGALTINSITGAGNVVVENWNNLHPLRAKDSDDYSPTFTTQNLTDPSTGVRLSGNNIDRNARLRVTANWLHAQDTCPACDEIRKQMAAGNVLALFDISLTGYHTGTYEIFIPFSGTTGQSYTTLHCLKGTLEQKSAPYQNGGTTTIWAKLSPFAVIKDASVTVPDNVVVNPPKTGDGNGYGILGTMLILCALGAWAMLQRRTMNCR